MSSTGTMFSQPIIPACNAMEGPVYFTIDLPLHHPVAEEPNHDQAEVRDWLVSVRFSPLSLPVSPPSILSPLSSFFHPLSIVSFTHLILPPSLLPFPPLPGGGECDLWWRCVCVLLPHTEDALLQLHEWSVPNTLCCQFVVLPTPCAAIPAFSYSCFSIPLFPLLLPLSSLYLHHHILILPPSLLSPSPSSLSLFPSPSPLLQANPSWAAPTVP